VVDTITAPAGVDYEVLSTSPPASLTGYSLAFTGIGPIGFGQSRTLSIRVKVADDAAAGRFRDEAVATGLCGRATVGGGAATETAVKAAMQGRVTLDAPEVERVAAAAPVTGSAAREVLPAPAQRSLARTGGNLLAVVPALALITGGRLLKGRSGRRR
jgi:hypothetical protein